MIAVLKHVCRIFIIWWFGVVGMFLYAYTPTVDEQDLITIIMQKVDELAVQSPDEIQPLYAKVHRIYQVRIVDASFPERKKHILQELDHYLYDTYIDVEPPWIDIESDNSLHKYVSRNVWFTNKYYIPADLVMMYPNESLSLALSDEGLSYMSLSSEVLPWLQELSIAFYEHFGIPLKVNSAWRSYEFQRDGFTQECRDSGFCAEPWYSEHQHGYAVDISGMFGEKYEWMVSNAHKYGFHQSYQKWVEIDYYPEEKWHRRYFWQEFAKELHDAWQTFTERVESGAADSE